MYQWYLAGYSENSVDAITQYVAENTVQFLHLFNADISIVNDSGSFVKLIYNQIYIARIIEGCNAVSVIILFVSFIIAFSGKLKQTVLFVLAGSLVIYLLNVIRIALLTVLIYRYPSKEALLHGAFFPLFIYGVVFILWFVWVNNFSVYAKKTV